MRLPCLGLSRGGDGAVFGIHAYQTPRVTPLPRETSSLEPIELRNRARLLSAILPRKLHRLRTTKSRLRLPLKKQTSLRVQAARVSEEPNPYNAPQPRTPKEIHKPTLGQNIPWGWTKIIQVMLLWLLSFMMCRSFIWKAGMWLLGIASEAELSACGQAAFTLFLDLAMLVTTINIIGKTLKEYRPFKQSSIFPYALKGRWWITVILACFCIPVVDWLGTHMTVWFPEEIDLPTNNVVVQLSRGDVVPNVLYFVLLAMCAPVWEELMFRGFLLQSLGKFLPASVAISVSSAIFALMHGNMRQFLPLWVLGVIIGQAFVHTRNLFPAMLLHSLYNCYVFAHVLFGN